ncbi:o-succinylbenzoate synthase [Corynebacterium sp. P7202]|uniref:o-succinylbenzoate synthase n=1 Tax=Corynebacterium pygosceleis TaxID=2800406 RepID=A0A9Q4C8S9_9CORY|nr:o-succinylbenzoate synthase [Corynebacterium pygosceleis]MCK7637463.1 o-succinylbenzoate synthase [Corynebacterium pygosceleis]MCX7445008.1 o-succinylbenzoate synthase [Corynebacterium pygosceleis]MCX7468208.1 o-succinylbenzoate synthase [Corynebacterium pygosceleis]
MPFTHAPLDSRLVELIATLDADELIGRAHTVALPMQVRFRGVTRREALLLDGPVGWGEFAPFRDYGPVEAAAWLAAALEMAYLGAPTPERDRIEINATVPAVEPGEVPEILARFPGCRTVKVKVAEAGQTLDDDVARVAAVREAVPNALVRVDANRGFTVDRALDAARALGPLDYFEQPCATTAELAELRQRLVRSGIFCRVAADESIRRAGDPFAVLDARALDVAVVKVAPLGGVRRLLDIAEKIAAHGVSVTVASALDTAVGLNAGLAAVAALPGHTDDDEIDVPPAPAGLGTGGFFVEDVVDAEAAGRTIVDGHLSCAPVEPDTDRLADLAADTGTVDFWHAHLREALRHLKHQVGV